MAKKFISIWFIVIISLVIILSLNLYFFIINSSSNQDVYVTNDEIFYVNDKTYKCNDIEMHNCDSIRECIANNKTNYDVSGNNQKYSKEELRTYITKMLAILDKKCFCWAYSNQFYCEYDERLNLILVLGQYSDRGIYYVGEPAEIVYSISDDKLIYEYYPEEFLYTNAIYINGNIASYKDIKRTVYIDKEYIIGNYKKMVFQDIIELYGEPNGMIMIDKFIYPYYELENEIIIIKNDLSSLHNYKDLINGIEILERS